MKNTLIFLTLTGLTACGGGGTTGSITLTPATKSIAVGSAALGGFVPSGLNNLDPITTLTSSGAPLNGALFSNAMSSGAYGAGVLISGNTFDIIAFSDDGASSSSQSVAISANAIGRSANNGTFGQIATYSRTGTTLMPVSGTATYTGEYRGTYGSQTTGINGSAMGGLIAVTGTANIPINFTTSSIAGATITGRTELLANGSIGGAFADVMLGTVSINGLGEFSGTATGGLMAGQTPVSATFEGMIGGSFGNATAGAIRIESQDASLNTFTEVGVFTAIRP